MTSKRLALLAAAAGLAAGCATVLQTKVRSDPAADFSKYKTFQIQQGRMETDAQAFLNNEISKRLEQKGLVPAEKDPDLKVVPRIFRQQSTQQVTGFGWWTGGLTTESTENIPAGTLVVDLLDTGRLVPGREQLVWRAQANGTIPPTGGLKRDKVEFVLDRMFADYPPKKAKT